MFSHIKNFIEIKRCIYYIKIKYLAILPLFPIYFFQDAFIVLLITKSRIDIRYKRKAQNLENGWANDRASGNLKGF